MAFLIPGRKFRNEKDADLKVSWGDRARDDASCRNHTGDPALRGGLKGAGRRSNMGVDAWGQGDAMERELVETGTVALGSPSKGHQDPCGEGNEKHAPSPSERRSWGFVKRMEVGEDPVKKRKSWRDWRRKINN